MKPEEYLREINIKVTKARVNILSILIESHKSLNVEYIFKKCKEKNVEVDISTIYRALDIFCSKAIVKKFDLGEGKYSYSIKKEDHKHVLQCKVCNKKVEIDCPMQQIEEIIKCETGFTLVDENLDLEIDGICESCRKK